MALLARRSAPGNPRFIEWKVWIFAVAAGLALVGMAREQAWLVGLAIAILAAGFLLRLVPHSERGEGGDDDAGDAANTPGPEDTDPTRVSGDPGDPGGPGGPGARSDEDVP